MVLNKKILSIKIFLKLFLLALIFSFLLSLYKEI